MKIMVYDANGILKTSGLIAVTFTATPTGIFDSSVSTSGGIAQISLAMDNQNGNTILASPSDGSSGTPTFRALVNADIPATLSGKTLVTPTIASFTNATHDHEDAAGGGQLTGAAVNVTDKSAVIGGGTSGLTGLAPGTNRNVMISDGTDWTSRAIVPADVPASLVLPVCTFRLSLANTANAAGDTSGASTIYAVNWLGNSIRLYDGSAWSGLSPANAGSISFAVSQTISSTTTNASTTVTVASTALLSPGMSVSGTGISGGTTIASITNATTYELSAGASASATNNLTYAIPANKVFDVFGYQSGSDLKLGIRIWTSDTTRATALAAQDGVLVLNGNATWLYLGTARTDGSSQLNDSVLKRTVWNLYNARQRAMRVVDTTNSEVYTTTSYKQAFSNAANQVEVVVGLDEYSLISLNVIQYALSSSATPYVGIGEDSVTATITEQIGGFGTTNGVNEIDGGVASVNTTVPLGYHYYAWIYRGATGCTFYGDNGVTQMQSGMNGWVMA